MAATPRNCLDQRIVPVGFVAALLAKAVADTNSVTMMCLLHSAPSALIEQSEWYIERLRTLIADSDDQGRLALDLIAQSQDYIERVEDIEASRIEELASGDPG